MGDINREGGGTKTIMPKGQDEKEREVGENIAEALKYMENNKWTIEPRTWIHFKKGEYHLKDEGTLDEGSTNETYKIYIQPDFDHLGEAIENVAIALDNLIDEKKISGALGQVVKVYNTLRDEDGFHLEDIEEPYFPKILIYANSKEDMIKVVKALNAQFGEKAFEYGTEKNLDAYSQRHGARYTYGISPLIHVRRGGEKKHFSIGAEQPPKDWDIDPETINELRENAISYIDKEDNPGPKLGQEQTEEKKRDEQTEDEEEVENDEEEGQGQSM